MNRAKIAEVFFSIQGEGPFIGTPQVFVRFFGCNIACRYCDTRSKRFKVFTAKTIRNKVIALSKAQRVRHICFTGGEPLLQADFLNMLLSKGIGKNNVIYLETNGILTEEFKKVKRYVDIVAMDIKLPSATAAGEYWNEHRRFLRMCNYRKVFIKIVITLSTTLSDMHKAIDLVNSVNSDIIVILQPNHSQRGAALMEKVIRFQREALKKLNDVRIIPQMHKLMGVR